MVLNRRHFNFAAIGGAWRLRADTRGSGKIDETLSSGIVRRKIPAAVGIVATDNKVLYQGAFGTRDESGTPIRMDSIFGIASMTKPITTVAALQLVEQGKLQLEEPVSKYLPQLKNMEVLEGFDSTTGKPSLRPALKPITFKHLLTHTSGLCYDTWDADAFRYTSQMRGEAAIGKIGPLMFEPGTRWQYGMGVDWVGRLVEEVSGLNLEDYFRSNILRPLEMVDTSYILPASKFERLASSYQRQKDGTLKQDTRKLPTAPKAFNGGGGLYSTAGDYVRFMQMILRKGRGINNAQILSANTVENMEVNQIGGLTAGKMKSYRTGLSSDVDMQPGSTEKWGLGFLINTTPYAGGRSAGSLAWAGVANTFFWIDPKRSLCAALMMQFLPFGDKEAVTLLGEFERAVYQTY